MARLPIEDGDRPSRCHPASTLRLRIREVLKRRLFKIRIEIQIGTPVLFGESRDIRVTGQLPLLIEPRFDGLTSQGGGGTPDTLRLGAERSVKFGRNGYVEILHARLLLCHKIMAELWQPCAASRAGYLTLSHLPGVRRGQNGRAARRNGWGASSGASLSTGSQKDQPKEPKPHERVLYPLLAAVSVAASEPYRTSGSERNRGSIDILPRRSQNVIKQYLAVRNAAWFVLLTQAASGSVICELLGSPAPPPLRPSSCSVKTGIVLFDIYVIT